MPGVTLLDAALAFGVYNYHVRCFRCLALFVVLIFGALPAQAQSDPLGNRPARPRVAVLLAGGTARGLAYLGALEELVRSGVPIDLIVGTSAGAMVGGLYASGYSFETLREVFATLARKQDQLVRINFPFTQSLLAIEGFEAVYRALVNDGRIEDCSPRLAVMATELRPAPTTPILAGNLADAVRASISLPLLFPVKELEGKTYVDGGLRSPFPVETARALGADFVISVRGKGEGKARPDGLLDVLNFVVWTVTGSQTPLEFDASVPVKTFDTQYFDFSQASNLIERGRSEARQVLPKLLEALQAKGIALNPPGDPHEGNSINQGWRARLETGLQRAFDQPKPLMVAPVVELPSSDDWGTRPGHPNLAQVAAGVQVSEGALGPFGFALGYVELFDQPGGSGFARFGLRLGPGWRVYGAFDPARRPDGAPWVLGVEARATDFFGFGWRSSLELDALALDWQGRWTPELSPEWQPEFGFGARFGFAPSLRLELSSALTWRPQQGPWFVRAHGLFGLSTGGAQGFALGHASGLRAYPNDFALSPQAGVFNLEFGHRWLVPNLASLASLQPTIFVFADLGSALDFNAGSSRLIWDFGVGANAPIQWFGFLPARVGWDVAFSTDAWRINFYSSNR